MEGADLSRMLTPVSQGVVSLAGTINKLYEVETKQLAAQQQDNKQAEVSNEYLKKILTLQVKENKQETKEKKRAARDSKRRKADASLLKNIMGGGKKAGKKKQKGLFDWIKDALGGLFSIGGGKLAALLGLGALGIAIGGAIAAYIGSPKFRKAVNKYIFTPLGNFIKDTLIPQLQKALMGLGGIIKDTLQNNFPDIFGSRQVQKPTSTQEKAEAVEDWLTKFFTGKKTSQLTRETTRISRAMNEKLLNSYYEGDEKKREFYEDAKEEVDTFQTLSSEMDAITHKLEKTRAALRRGGFNEAQTAAMEKELQDQLINYAQKEKQLNAQKEKLVELQEKEIEVLEENFRLRNEAGGSSSMHRRDDALFEDFILLKKQRGGPINVPGTGTGDKIPMLLPGGSFVMNRNASAMLQEGGLVPTLLEPGEKVFGPGQWNPMHQLFNSMVPRFQEGGPVSETGTGRDGSEDAPGNATHEYLTKLNDKNINKVSAPPGMCVTGSLETMQASGVPNPAATGQDVGNNPRGMISQLVNDFGWKSMSFGQSKTLNSPYGDANVNVMSRSQWERSVNDGLIPSGALIFQTRHSDWNSTSPGSSGYDAAIAQKKGNGLWNGQELGSLVYGNTKGVISLTPTGKAAKPGDPGEDNFMDMAGNLIKNALGGDIMSMVGSIAGPVGELLTGVFKAAITTLGGPLLSLMGLGGLIAPAGAATLPNQFNNVDSVTGEADGNMVEGAKMLMKAGIPKLGAAYLAGNIMQESSWNGQRDWGEVAGDGTSRNGGLVSWASWADDPARLGKIEKHLGKNISEASDSEQLDAMLWEMKKDYPGAYSTFTNPNASRADLRRASKEYWGYGEEGARYQYSEQALAKLQKGGIASMRGSQSASDSRFKKAQEEFAASIAEAAKPIVIPVPTGAGGGHGGSVISNPGNQTSPPQLPDGPSSVQSAEYFYRLSLGSVY